MAEVEHKHWRENTDQKYLRNEMLEQGEKRILTIIDVKGETLENPENGVVTKKNVLYFRPEDKTLPLALNAVNSETIESLYGGFIDGWVGKKIQIFVTKVKAFGRMTPCIRIEKIVPQTNEIQYLCSVCNKPISKSLYDSSIKKYGKPYCSPECHEHDMKEKEIAENGEDML